MTGVSGKSFILGGVPFVLGFSSFFAVIWMIINLRKLKMMLKNSSLTHSKQQPVITILTTHLYFMTLCQLPQSFCISLTYFSFFINKKLVPKKSQICIGLGFLLQFGAIATTMFYGAAMWCIQLVITGNSSKIFQQLTFHRIICWITVAICVIIPLFGNAYGGMPLDLNGNHSGVQCWITKRNYFLAFYIPLTSVLLFAVYLVVFKIPFTFYTLRSLNVRNNIEEKIPLNDSNNQISKIVRDIIKFGLAFIIVSSMLVISRLYQVIAAKKLPLWANVFHNIGASSWALILCFVWKRSLQNNCHRLLTQNNQFKQLDNI